MDVPLTEETFISFAMHNYDKVQCTIEEFNEDLNRFKILNRLFCVYKDRGSINENLALNHIIILYNVFNEAATKMLFFKINREYWIVLKPFLILLNRLPDSINGYNMSEIQLDNELVQRLRSI